MHNDTTMMVFAGLVAGVGCGLLPLLIACAKRRPWLGILALAVCVAGGFAMGLIIALPVGLFSALGLSNLEKARRRG